MTPAAACLVIHAARAGAPGHLVAEHIGARNWRTLCGRTVRGVPQPVGAVTCNRCLGAQS